MWTVWVGGGEVNNNLLTKDAAEALARSWRARGYEDVIVEQV